MLNKIFKGNQVNTVAADALAKPAILMLFNNFAPSPEFYTQDIVLILCSYTWIFL